jgi:hypothetical protein
MFYVHCVAELSRLGPRCGIILLALRGKTAHGGGNGPRIPLVALYYWRISGGRRSDADARLARRVPYTTASDLVFS